MKIQTFPYKGSKRKLLDTIYKLAIEINAKSVFDGFSGTGIVSAMFRQNGLTAFANDLGDASCLAGRVFLRGFDEKILVGVVKELNEARPDVGWLTKNYSGEQTRKVRGKEKKEVRPMGFIRANAKRLDAARNLIEALGLSSHDRDAAILAVILAANRCFNGSNDQKSSLSEWTSRALLPVEFRTPTLIDGPEGFQTQQDILKMEVPSVDFVYLDPPYGSGVLYPACYHINDSLTKWDKPELNTSYALPRPDSVCFAEKGEEAGGFYNKKTATESMDLLLSKIAQSAAKRCVISYSDAPRNVISQRDLVAIASKYGSVQVITEDHQLCAQPNSMNKVSDSLQELFIVIDF